MTGVVVAVLALGLGTTTATFAVANAVLLRPLPFADAGRLVQIGSVGLLEFRAFREQGHAITALASYSTANKTFLESGEPERIAVVTTEAGLFDLLGTPALAGRTFQVGDPEDVVVLGERFWRRRFAARPLTEDWTISLDGKAYMVLGVMPEAFQFPFRSEAMDVWIPAALPRVDSPFQRIDAAVGRLSPIATLDAARAELVAIASRTGLRNVSVDPIPISALTDAVVGPARRMVLTLFAGGLMVLLAACATAANLLLARAESRRRDTAIRRALGAGSAHLLATFLTESLLLAAASTLGALLIAVAATRALLARAAAVLPRASEIGLSPMTIVVLLALALGVAIACGIAPAFIAMKCNAAAALSASDDRLSRTPRSAAVQDALVITEIALAVVLTIGAGLIVRAFVALRHAPVGLKPAGVLTLRLETRGLVPETAGPTETHSTPQGRYFQAIEDRVRQVPGVTAAGFVTRLHVQSPGNTGRYTIAGRPLNPTDRLGRIVRLREASPGYFQALGVPVRAGRLFDARTGGILVNEAFAREHLQGEDAVGLVLNRGTIVGVVGDVRQRVRTQAEPEIYASIAATSYSAATLVVKAAVPPEAVIAPLRAAVRELNANQAVFDVRTMDEVVAAAYADVGLALRLAGFSAALAILLSMAGVYAVLSANVSARRREFGIRLALGADPRRLLRTVAARAGAIITVGTAVGVVGALALTRFLRSLLYEVGPGDPGTFAAATLAFTIVAAIAGVAPARRAMTVDPLTVLRHE